MDGVHSTTSRRRGAPLQGQRLSRDAVVAAAEESIAQQGVAGFSLRDLAGSLGVAPNALYNHVRNRDDLLNAVTERFVAGIQLPESRQPWPDWVRTVATGLREQLTERPGLTELVLARGGSTPTGPTVLAGFLDRLTSAGLDPAVAHLAWHTMLAVVIGSVPRADAGASASEPTFEAVLDVVVDGLVATAQHPTSPRARDLLEAHRHGDT